MFGVRLKAGLVQRGKVRALAVTSAKRSAMLPDTPTLQEAGIAGFDVSSWQGIYAPAGTPPAVVERLNTEIQKIINEPDMAARMAGLGLAHQPNTPAQFAAFGAQEITKWTRIVKEGKLQP